MVGFGARLVWNKWCRKLVEETQSEPGHVSPVFILRTWVSLPHRSCTIVFPILWWNRDHQRQSLMVHCWPIHVHYPLSLLNKTCHSRFYPFQAPVKAAPPTPPQVGFQPLHSVTPLLSSSHHHCRPRQASRQVLTSMASGTLPQSIVPMRARVL